MFFLTRHVKPEYARRLKEEKKSGGLGWHTQAWKQGLFENMCVHRHREVQPRDALRSHPTPPGRLGMPVGPEPSSLP